MKSILFAIVCLAASASVGAEVCTLSCSGNWTGQSSVVVEIGKEVDIIFDVEEKIFAVINTNLSLSVAANNKFVFVLNITSGNYLLIDINTQFAVIGHIQIDFLLSGGGIDYNKFVEDVSLVFAKYTSITSSTSGSFNFGLIIIAYYAGNFNLAIIVGETIAAELSASFSIWLTLVQNAIRSGYLTLSNGIWGFLAIVTEFDISLGLAIFEVIKVSVETFHEIEVELIVELIARLRQSIQSVITYSIKIVSYISVSVNVTITSILSYVNNVANNPVSYNITIGGSTYGLVVIKVDGQYVLQLTASSGSSQQLNLQFIFAGDVLIIYNLRTNIAVALYRRYLLVLNTTAEVGLLFTWQLFTGIKLGVVNTTRLSADLRAGLYAKVAADFKAIIQSNSSSLTISWSAFYKAVISGSVSAVGSLVGSGNASFVITYYFSFCGATSGSSSIGGIVVAVFSAGASSTVLVRGISIACGAVINGLANTSQDWSVIIKFLTSGGSYKITTG